MMIIICCISSSAAEAVVGVVMGDVWEMLIAADHNNVPQPSLHNDKKWLVLILGSNKQILGYFYQLLDYNLLLY